MAISCENCGSEDLTVIKCPRCGGEKFLKQKVSKMSDKNEEDMRAYSHFLSNPSNSNYGYACYNCGEKLTLS